MNDMNANRIFLTIATVLVSVSGAEATDYIRYVSKEHGAYNNDGTSWTNAKINVQDAINDIKDKLEAGDRGYIFVQEGLYRPTQAVPGSNGSTLYMSIQIPAGMSVYGGFAGNETGADAAAIIASRETISTPYGTYMKRQTVFSGSLSSTFATYSWNEKKNRYNTSYYGNCYHVVWFANNGSTTDNQGVARYTALSDSAVLDGVVIRDGYAFNSDINTIEHNAFGGGAYLVEGAIVRNCEVFHCEASRSGGGLYLDRGGRVENCYVHDCQCLGVNSQTGFGGGVAVDQQGLVSHCALVNNVGRSGGGLSLTYNTYVSGYNQYGLTAAACLIAQNTSTVEAGGVYLDRGGLLNGVTIVNNKTCGTGVTLNGVVTGRSGGIYVRNHARIYNSVLWGNATTASNTHDLQYAATRSSADNALKPLLTYVALSRADYTDWSGTKKIGISKLADSNADATATSSVIKYPMFENPCSTVGHIDDQAGIGMSDASSYVANCYWKPTSSSSLCYAGLQMLDIPETMNYDLSSGYIVADLEGQEFSPKCALGTYAASAENIVGTTINGTFTLFVDPDRIGGRDYSEAGKSWDSPLDNLTDALSYMKGQGKSGQICVKEGTLFTASRSAHSRLRGTTIPMASGVSVVGGYPTELTGTDLSKRNPVAYPTIISGQITQDDYASNVAHLVTFDGVTGSTLDGFELRWGNAASTVIADYGQQGAGIVVKGDASATLKNLTVADCTAAAGSALYVESGSVEGENCILRNNASTALEGAALYVATGASVTLNHCDVVRNVGYAVYNQGTFTTNNSLYYSNMSEAVDDTNGKDDKALPVFAGSGTFAGSTNLFDKASAGDARATVIGQAIMDWTFTTASITYPRFVNCTKNAGVSEAGDVTYYGRAVDYTPSDMNPAVNAASTNGVAHTGALSDGSWGTDMTTVANRDFGGLPDIGALENGASSANSATQPSYGTVYYVRDYRDASGNVDYTAGGNGLSWSTAINGNAWYNESTGENLGLAPVDYTYKIQNAFMYSSPYNGKTWIQNGTSYTNGNYSSRLACAPFANTDFDIYQTLTGLPEGWYYLSCQGLYRYGLYSENPSYTGESKAELYAYGASQVSTPLMNLKEEAAECLRLDVASVGGSWQNNLPDNINSASYCFNYGLYANNGLWVRVKDTGTLTIGVRNKNHKNNDWTVVSNFQLKYYGTTQPAAVGINGLQMAVNKANAAMSPYFEESTVVGTEKDSYSNTDPSLQTTRTFQKFEPTDAHPQVNVYVGAGIYTNHDGFKLRNHVKTYGAFPKTGNPGMNERHPQLTEGIPLSSANAGLKVADYETILQTNASIDERNQFKKSVGVLEHPFECRVTVYDDMNKHHTRTVYEDVLWDGFTFRYGCKEGVIYYNASGRRNGGAGVSIYENVTICNSVIRDNYTGDGNMADGTKRFRSCLGRGGGFYCDGGIIENCYIMDNISDCTYNTYENYGGGLYMIRGTMYNTVVAGNRFGDINGNLNNEERAKGNGVFFESAKFYNNTIVNNFGGTSAIGVYTASAEDASLTVYNSIVMDENVPILRLEGKTIPAKFDHCFLQTGASNREYEDGYTKTTYTDCVERIGVSANNANPFALPYVEAVANKDYRINYHTDSTNCVNAGTENLGTETYYNKRDAEGVPQAKLTENVYLPDNDMDWADRIQDCRVDIGAYEYNGAAAISPDETAERTGGENIKVYYVTELGFGTTQAYDPANAACAQKLQKVLDAAGRYKYDNPEQRVIVKLAGVDATKWSNYAKQESECFKYYPCRTTDETDDNVRVWSIMVPRGVEVWGGYSVEDVLSETTNDAIAPCFSDDERSVMYHPTYLQTEYDNSSLNETVKGYHVVTFTDRTFDEDGNEREGMLLSQKTTDRAVLDGLFLVGGQADGESNGSTAAVQNVNQFGGAAVVTDYAHVRNCIVKSNTATYGGALALMPKALVSGSLIIDNEAEQGGGLYVFEDGVRLSSDPDTELDYANSSASSLDANMPHIYTTTVVKNTGSQQGGGLWFSNDADLPNVRVNSTVLWQNESPDQANVAGQTSPSMPDGSDYSTFDWYPFAYSAVQNLRVSGASNISVDIQNKSGNRFGIDSRTDADVYTGKDIAADTTQVDYYGLTVFSALCRTGMPWSNYEELVGTLGLASQDYNGWSRDTIPADTKNRSYVDIGARAYPSSPTLDLNHPFLRLFVAETQDVDMDAYQAMQDFASTASTSDPNYIYGLLGSSFAYPFQNIDDALSYISELRKADQWQGKLNNVPFEICIARGEYYPQRDMQGNYGYSLANTYLIPEGVTLMGGFDCTDLYGQYWKVDADREASAYTNVLSGNIARFSNDVINQVGATGNKVEIQQLMLDTLAERRTLEDLNLNDILEPWEFRNQTNLSGNTVNLQNSGVYHVVSVIPYAPGVGQLPLPAESNDTDFQDNGSNSRYVGQPVIIDGVHISDGYAQDLVPGSITDNGRYDYYRGAGIRANGNWICENTDGTGDGIKSEDNDNAVAYRDIPLYIRNSQFVNNRAGYGGAIDANVSTHIYNCLFAENEAVLKTDNYPGDGGAIHFTNSLEVYNTIFSNNEAQSTGAALYGGEYSRLKALNCDFVRNRAVHYPAIFTLNPSAEVAATVGESGYNMVANNVFWGNEATSGSSFADALCINYRRKDVTGTYNAGVEPESQEDLDGNYAEALWFSGYEQGRGKTTVNTYDMREFDYNANEYIATTLRNYWDVNYAEAGIDYPELNANITLSSDNSSLEGPNFCNPSTTAGYDGYSEAADWSRARLNNLTDNGSCMLRQNVVNNGAGGYSYSWNTTDAGLDGTGIYYTAHYMNAENQRSVDLGSDIYMRSAETEANLPRVASDPSPTRTKAYVDLGVYEYPHTRLNPSIVGDAVDILWVSTIEKAENGTPDGSTWETPTSDLQRAIETLMSSRNSHRKEIRLMDGEYAPVYTRGGYKAFYLNTEELNNSVVFPEDAYSDQGDLYYTQPYIDNYFVRSLTFKGGYSKDLRDQYDTELYPAVVRSPERLDGTSNTWDYLFLIDDATQRYGKGDLAADGYGAKASSDATTRTIPVEFDGITFVNNQSLSGTHGTAIRYNDQVNTYDVDGVTHTDYANAPATSNVTITKAEYDAMRQSDDAATVQSAKCTYWTDDTYTEQLPAGQTSDYVLYYRTVQNPPKLTISKCCVMNSGTHYDASTREDYSSSAVYIGQYGGDAIIYNSVFHSNWGNPLEAYNTRTINNTVALNHGRWILMNTGSLPNLYETGSTEGKSDGPMLARKRAGGVVNEMTTSPRHSNILNTVLWRNNPSGSIYGSQFSLAGFVSESDAASDSIFCRNAYTYYNNGVQDVTEGTDYNEFAPFYWNTHLSNTNSDIACGPNFKDPILTAATDEEIESRDFSLQPSIRLINKGEKTTYANQVYDQAWIPTTELDFINQSRVISLNIEVGAIEYQQPLLRVIYVDPNLAVNGSGIDWETPMNSDNLQNAIDLAAIYSATNKPERDDDGNVTDYNEAYVFVKGDNDNVLPGITMRSGVNIFGSVDPNCVTGVDYSKDEETGEYIYPNLASDVEAIANQRPGLLSPSTERTIVRSVVTGENDAYSTEQTASFNGALLSSVAITSTTDDNPSGAITEPVLDIHPKSQTGHEDEIPAVAVMNVLVAGNDASKADNGTNIANIDNALIYEVLFRDNTTSTDGHVLNLGSTGYGVNLTVEGLTNDAAGNEPSGEDCLTDNVGSGHIWYSIYNYKDYARDEQTLSKHNYRTADPNLNYQLTEHSLNIDACQKVNPMSLDENINATPSTRNLAAFINYDTDRDLLGNPRVLNTVSDRSDNQVLDRGAFETWCIGNDDVALTVTGNTDANVYGGNYYPHDGSVVYLLQNSNYIAEAHSLQPAYLLVKKGASLYGHGQTIRASFLAVERDVNRKGTIVALPYPMDYTKFSCTTDNTVLGSATGLYDESTHVLTLKGDAATTAYAYNGKTRAAARYQIQNSASECWEDMRGMASTEAEVCQGVLFTCSKDTTYRFTAQGVTLKNYLYTEQPEVNAQGAVTSTAKVVTLHQNNNQPTDGLGNLTSAEDMGWNCFGIPYLVSEYKPYTMAYDAVYNTTAGSLEYLLQAPKNIWIYYDGAQPVSFATTSNWSAADARNYAGFYAVESWKSSAADWHLEDPDNGASASVVPALWVGEGMFAQTASFADEDLFFYLPVYEAPSGNAAAVRSLTRLYIGTPAIEESDADASAVEGMFFDLQGRRIQTPAAGSLYIRSGRKVWQ